MSEKEISSEFEEMIDDEVLDSEDLDEYGVWVKSNPKDREISEALSFDQEEEIELDSSYLSDEEEDLLGELEETESLDDGEYKNPDAEEQFMNENNHQDGIDEEEFSIEIPEIDEDTTELDLEDEDALGELNLDDLEEDEISLDLEEELGEDFLGEDELNLDLDSPEDSLDFDSLEDDATDTLDIPSLSMEESLEIPSLDDEDTDSDEGSIEEIDLEIPSFDEDPDMDIDLPDEDTLEPSAVAAEQLPDIGELPDLDDDFLNLEEDIDLDLDAYAKDQTLSEDGLDATLPGSDEDTLDIEDIQEQDEDEVLPELDDFDDVEALAEELTESHGLPTIVEDEGEEPLISVLGSQESPGIDGDRHEMQPQGTVQIDPGSSILSSIESELSAIKFELTSLRQELQQLRSEEQSIRQSLSETRGLDETPNPTIEEPTPSTDEEAIEEMSEEVSEEITFDDDYSLEEEALIQEESEESEGSTEPEATAAEETSELPGGFFEDDEDETIALTGDELDNILNTAEFIEEAGEPSEFEEEVLENDDFDSYIEDDEPEVTDITLEEVVIEEVAIEEEEPEEEISADDPFAGSEAEVKAMAELDIDKELEGIDDLEDESLQVDFDETELEKMTIEIPDSFEELGDLDENKEDELDDDDSVDDEPIAPSPKVATNTSELSTSLKDEIKSVLAYMDKLLEALPEEKIEEFARSEHFEVYKRLFEELGL